MEYFSLQSNAPESTEMLKNLPKNPTSNNEDLTNQDTFQQWADP